jgi:hypothetical protein
MTMQLTQPNNYQQKLESLGVDFLSPNLVQTNNISSELLSELEVSFEQFILDFSNFYNQIADTNSDFIQKNSIESLINTILKGDAVLTFNLAAKESSKYEIIGFAKIGEYANTPDGVGCDIDASNAIKIVEIGNLMTKPGFTGHGIATKGVLKCLEIAQSKYSEYHPIAVVHTKNYPSLGVFGKFVKMNQASLFKSWPQWVTHSEHEGALYTDEMEVCFDLFQIAKNIDTINYNLINNNSNGAIQPKEA